MTALAVWRICYNGDLRLGALPHGSTLGPGRWHLTPPQGLPVVYAASSRALAQLEKRVHANGIPPVRQALIRLALPSDALVADAVRDFTLESPRWLGDEGYTQSVGLRWLKAGTSLGLWVPSYVEPREKNMLINPMHPAYSAIKIEIEMMDFVFDPRLF